MAVPDGALECVGHGGRDGVTRQPVTRLEWRQLSARLLGTSGTSGLSSIQMKPQVSHLKNRLVDKSATTVRPVWSHTGQWPSQGSVPVRLGSLENGIRRNQPSCCDRCCECSTGDADDALQEKGGNIQRCLACLVGTRPSSVTVYQNEGTPPRHAQDLMSGDWSCRLRVRHPEESIAHLPDFGLRPLVIPPGLHGHSAAATWMDSRPSHVSSPEPSGTPNPGGL